MPAPRVTVFTPTHRPTYMDECLASLQAQTFQDWELLIYDSFSEFYENNVMKYENYEKLKVHFTGSIAFYFSDILRQVANDKGITVKNILEGPIAGLTLFHQSENE